MYICFCPGNSEQKYRRYHSSLRGIQLFWDTETEQFGGEFKIIPCFYSHSFWQSHHIRDSETVISMVCKSVQYGRYQRLDGPGSYSYLVAVKYYLEACRDLARMRHRLLAHKRKKEDVLQLNVLEVVTLASGTVCNTKLWVSEGLQWIMEICNIRGTAVSAQNTFLQRATSWYWWQELSNQHLSLLWVITKETKLLS